MRLRAHAASYSQLVLLAGLVLQEEDHPVKVGGARFRATTHCLEVHLLIVGLRLERDEGLQVVRIALRS